MAGPFFHRLGGCDGAMATLLAAGVKRCALLAIAALVLVGSVVASPSCTLANMSEPQVTFGHTSKPRAALVCLTSDSDVVKTVSTIIEVESRFNSAYNYDWAVFSREELSHATKDALSNATGGAAITFNLIPDEHWTLPKARWNAGLFARENRLRSYDWFWKVDPGSQFSYDFSFDVFHAMRDTQIAYGANSVSLASTESARVLRQSARKFIAHHRQTIVPEADFTWILGPSDAAIDAADDLDYLTDLGFNKHKPYGDSPKALPSRGGHNQSVSDCAEFHTCQIDAPFDMGSLDMLRGSEFRAYFDHLDAEGTFLYHHIPDSTVKSLGVSLLLPRSRIWRMDDVSCTAGGDAYCLPPDDSTVALDRHRRRFLAAMLGGPALGWSDAMLEDEAAPAALWRQYWEQVANQLDYLQPLTDPGRGHTSLEWGEMPAEVEVVWASCMGMLSRCLVGDRMLRVLFSQRVLYYLLGVDAGILCEVIALDVYDMKESVVLKDE